MNTLLVWLRMDGLFVRYIYQWKNRKYIPEKTLQENVGLSHRPDVDEALARVHEKLHTIVEANAPYGSRLLDVGSGTALVARQLCNKWRVTGIDVSDALTIVARQTCPQAEFIVGDILDLQLSSRYTVVYCIGVLMYIRPSRLRPFFKRIHDVLEPGGVFFLQYTHALSRKDLWYPDMASIRYSPRCIERLAREFFTIDEHHHSSLVSKVVDRYDTDPIPTESFANGYLLISRKLHS